MSTIKNKINNLIPNAFKENIRDYGMYIALAVIVLIFTKLTDGLFLTPRVVSDLINMTGYIAVLAVGMTLVIVISHIDLSVGFVAGFLGAIAAILSSRVGLSIWLIIPIVLVIGLILGLFNGYLVANFGIPAFVVTLAGMLVFKGALIRITNSQTIFTENETFNAIGNGYIPDFMKIEGIHSLTILIGLVALVCFGIIETRNRQKQKTYGLHVTKFPVFILKLIFISGIVMYFFWKLASFKGLSWTAVIVAVVVIVYSFVTKNTTLGRHIYAVGGNPEAAELSGISVKFITLVVFGSMTMLAALSGILFTARLQSAAPTAGVLFELDAIAAAYVGGVSANGGVGKVTGSIIGALVMASLTKGMDLMGVGVSYQYMIRGAILVLAVVFDVKTRNIRSKKA